MLDHPCTTSGLDVESQWGDPCHCLEFGCAEFRNFSSIQGLILVWWQLSDTDWWRKVWNMWGGEINTAFVTVERVYDHCPYWIPQLHSPPVSRVPGVLCLAVAVSLCVCVPGRRNVLLGLWILFIFWFFSSHSGVKYIWLGYSGYKETSSSLIMVVINKMLWDHSGLFFCSECF